VGAGGDFGPYHSKFKIQNSKFELFFRAHGLGNDYLVVDGALVAFTLTPPVARMICDRHVGFGSDGVLERVPSDRAQFGVRIYNPDGSEAEKSGNGLRIYAAYLLEEGLVAVGERFTVETLGGIVTMEVLHVTGDGVIEVEVEIGIASFRSADVGMIGPDREVEGEILELPAGDRLPINTVSIGNPHCVCFQDELNVEELRRCGPQISTHPWFANGINVQYARATGPDEVEALIWERGAGETLASGSSACAVAAAAVRRGLVQERRVNVRMPGGTLTVTVGEKWDILLRGPVESVYRAEPTRGFLRRLQALS
jgi:diaminopimelate epimerase